MSILYFFLFIHQILTLNINLYSTEPYVDLDWTKIDISRIEISFLENISRSEFKRIFLTNETSANEIDIINNCFFYTNIIRCIISPNIITGDPDNKQYKYYYRLMYQLIDNENNSSIESTYVTVSVNNGFIFKSSLFLLIFLIF